MIGTLGPIMSSDTSNLKKPQINQTDKAKITSPRAYTGLVIATANGLKRLVL